MLKKFCTGCGELKPDKLFSARSASKDGLQGYCKDCFSDYHFRRRQNRNKCTEAGVGYVDGRTGSG
jgi:hypothetical protein